MTQTPLRVLTTGFVVTLVIVGALLIADVVPGDAGTGGGTPSVAAPGAIAPPVDGDLVLNQIIRLQTFVETAEAQRLAEEADALRRLAEAEDAARVAEAAEEAERRALRAAAGLPDDSYWERMARCETGGNWSMTGSRYSGGVGFYNGTWDAWGGREFATLAGNATREQQIVVANRVATQGYHGPRGYVAPVGYSGWGCVKSVGYP
jgi:hypothetical protein